MRQRLMYGSFAFAPGSGDCQVSRWMQVSTQVNAALLASHVVFSTPNQVQEVKGLTLEMAAGLCLSTLGHAHEGGRREALPAPPQVRNEDASAHGQRQYEVQH